MEAGLTDHVWVWKNWWDYWSRNRLGLLLNRKLEMARISKESNKWYGKSNLLPHSVIVVQVASFTFRFRNVKQLRECITYYEKKTHPSSRIAAKALAADLGQDWRSLRGWDVERWFERLPMYLLEEPKRQKVVKALTKALGLVESGKL
jgi:hypothetical protein